MWVFLALLSALGLGLYDICKKRALTVFRVIPVLTGSVVTSSLLMLPMYLASRAGVLTPDSLLYVPHVSGDEELLIVIKALLVLSSWFCAYYALRRLPITVVTPMNATRPMWTLLGAVFIFGEVLDGFQWAGVALALVSFTAFSFVSMPRHRAHQENRGRVKLRESEFFPYLMMIGAVLLGAASGLYDKHLMRHIDHNAVLVYYTWWQAIFMLMIYIFDRRHAHKTVSPLATITAAENRRSALWIVGISLFLSLADFVYLLALSDPNSLIAVVSLLRRGSVLITFAYGALVLNERQIRRKAICLSGILMAMILLLIGSL